MASPRTPVLRTALAERDLLEIWRYIGVEQCNVVAADRLIRRVVERCGDLADNPDKGANRPDLGEGVQMLVVGNYLVFYLHEDGQVSVLRVLHGPRNIEKADVTAIE